MPLVAAGPRNAHFEPVSTGARSRLPQIVIGVAHEQSLLRLTGSWDCRIVRENCFTYGFSALGS